MSETQNVEYKSTWRDEYLKWICGFANANGGTIFVGKDDQGQIVGVPQAKKLLEDIPNKVRDILGILVDVNLHETSQGDYLEIAVEAYPNPVNYKGQYHYRSGATKQELKGVALDKFLLQKQGKRWDSVPITKVAITDLKEETLTFFRERGIRSKRLPDTILQENTQQLLENLNLIEDVYLKRAAVLLFHPNPEKFVTGAYIKIGYFQREAELLFQDEVHGNLIEQVEKTIDLLFTKYIKALISYEGIHRVETYEYPKEAVREALLNAVAHKDYSGLTPIQIRVYKDRLMIWNQGSLPENWTIEKLLSSHSSRPYNPDIANAFFRGGYVESWGRGISIMAELCQAQGLPKPLYNIDGSDFWIEFRDLFNTEGLKEKGLNERQIKAVFYVKENEKITNKEYQELNKISTRTAAYELKELVEEYKIFKMLGASVNKLYMLINS